MNNYLNIPTQIWPNYGYIVSENLYLKNHVAYQAGVMQEQQKTINDLRQSNAVLQNDAARWEKFKKIMDSQRGELSAQELQNIVDFGNRKAEACTSTKQK